MLAVQFTLNLRQMRETAENELADWATIKSSPDTIWHAYEPLTHIISSDVRSIKTKALIGQEQIWWDGYHSQSNREAVDHVGWPDSETNIYYKFVNVIHAHHGPMKHCLLHPDCWMREICIITTKVCHAEKCDVLQSTFCDMSQRQ